MGEHACGLGINRDCLRAYPSFARRAIAYRVLWKVLPGRVLGFLGMGVERPLIGAGVVVPFGVDFPGGWVVFPGVVFPDGWDLGDPLPPGVFGPPEFMPLLAGEGASEPLFVGFLGAGPVHRVAAGAGVAWTEIFTNSYWEGVAVPPSELLSIRWETDHWKVYNCDYTADGKWARLNVKTGTTWATGYRPSKCRVTFSGGSDPVKIRLYDTAHVVMAEELSAVSPAVIDLDFSSGLDIHFLTICDAVIGSHSALSFYVTNIEFA